MIMVIYIIFTIVKSFLNEFLSHYLRIGVKGRREEYVCEMVRKQGTDNCI